MPTAAPRPCARSGCARLVTANRYCVEHSRERGFAALTRQDFDRRRGTRTARGYNNTWLKASKTFRLKHPLCKRCEEQGRLTSAAVTDHVIPHYGDQTLFWDESNWQALCKSCHDAKTAREDGPAHAMPEWLPLPTCEVILVCGPPAAGKSSRVKARALEGDTIIDLDEIISELSEMPLYRAGQDWVRRGIRERNRRLASLSRMPAEHRAWVIVTGAKDKRGWWIEKLQPKEIQVIEVEEHVCEARVLADPRRALVRDRQLAAIRRWWSAERA